ncbi:MAG: TIGR03013 family XrtA/PEP-CTERM system glycosyltransferase [Halorhodospira sp.]
MRFFGHHISRKVLLLVGVEGLFALLGLTVILSLQAEVEPFSPEKLRLQFEVVLIALAVLLSMAGMGLYEIGQIAMRDGSLMVGVRLLLAMVVAWGGMVAVLGLLPELSIEASGLVPGLAVAFLVLLLERVLYSRFVRANTLKPRILILGVGSRATAVAELQGERSRAEMPYVVVGYVAPPGAKHFDVPEEEVIQQEAGLSLLALCRRYRIDELVVGVRERRGQLPVEELLECKLHEISVIDLTSFLERERHQLRLDSLNSSSLIFGEGFRQDGVRVTVKRGFDLIVSLALLLVTLPIMLVTALAIKLESPGPVFFCQQRIGIGNEPYWLFKFRSMREDAEQDGVPRWAEENDARITRIGSVIRKLRIDELPQIFNVLKGDMSFVGPRPERPIFVERLSEKIPLYRFRHTVAPGITGWAQVCYPYGASIQDAREKLQYDLYYLKNHTLFLDLVILIRTVAVVLFGQGAR